MIQFGYDLFRCLDSFIKDGATIKEESWPGWQTQFYDNVTSFYEGTLTTLKYHGIDIDGRS